MGRRVGIEVEFIGVDFDAASALLEDKLGSQAKAVSDHEHTFDTDAGDYRLEVDFELLKRLSRGQHESEEDDALGELAVEALSLAARVATPLELVTPPLPRDAVGDLGDVLDALAEAGARGTGDSLLYAFGVHFNPEADLATSSITAHLQAFLCLHDWLAERDATDLTRVVTAFALPFPQPYEKHVLAPDYAPDQATLIDDYLVHNATRNRALDMLPMFAHLDEARVRRAVDDERVNARPTFHYRLPNSHVGESDWRIETPWRDWLEVERLAGDAPRLAALCQKRLKYLGTNSLLRKKSDWVEQCQRSVEDR